MKQEKIDKYIVKLENGAYRIADTRISLDAIVYAFWRGESPEAIAENFPFLTPEMVYGAIAFYLANREEIDEYIKQGEIEFEKLRSESRKKNADLIAKLEKARKELKLTTR